MSHIGITPEIHGLAMDLANLGRDAERTCTGFSTPAAVARLIAELKTAKGKAHKLERALKARLDSAVAAERESARLQAAQHKPAARASAVLA